MTRPEAALIDELEFRSYVHNRKQFPEVEPARWALIFSNVPEMEERYLDMLSTGNIFDKFAGERAEAVVDGLTFTQPVVFPDQPSTAKTSPAIQTSTPLYLLASEIVGLTTKGYEQ